MPRPLILFLAFSLLSASLYADEFDPKALPAVKKALEKATTEVARNRKAYDEANEKAFDEAKETISKEVDKLSKAGKLEEAVAVKKFAETVSQHVLAKGEKKVAPPNPALQGAMAWNGHKYKVFNEPCSWHEAKKRCEEMGGHLVTISEEKEQAFVIQCLGRSGVPVDMTQRAWTGVWIGASDEAKEGEWKWVDGSVVAYRKWDVGEPNAGAVGNWLALAIHNGGMWDDRSAGDRHTPFFICEWDE